MYHYPTEAAAIASLAGYTPPTADCEFWKSIGPCDPMAGGHNVVSLATVTRHAVLPEYGGGYSWTVRFH